MGTLRHRAGLLWSSKGQGEVAGTAASAWNKGISLSILALEHTVRPYWPCPLCHGTRKDMSPGPRAPDRTSQPSGVLHTPKLCSGELSSTTGIN